MRENLFTVQGIERTRDSSPYLKVGSGFQFGTEKGRKRAAASL